MKVITCVLLIGASSVFGEGASPSQPAVEKSEAVVTIGGHVRRPGPVAYREKLSVFAAIQMAGGATEFGAMNRVKILRDGKVLKCDLTKDDQKILSLEPEDVVEVPQKNFFGR